MSPRVIVNCAAWTDVDGAESNENDAFRVNSDGPENLATAAKLSNSKLIHVSTDYVFSGEKGNYNEQDELMPQNKYAWSKLGGECAVQMLNDFVIIRMSFGPDIFPYKAAFIDQFTSREPASEIVKKIKNIVLSSFKGVIHIGGSRKSVYDYALSIGAESIDAISIKDMTVKMPKDTSLDTSLYKSTIE